MSFSPRVKHTVTQNWLATVTGHYTYSEGCNISMATCTEQSPVAFFCSFMVIVTSQISDHLHIHVCTESAVIIFSTTVTGRLILAGKYVTSILVWQRKML